MTSYEAGRIFGQTELETFLRSVDRHLSEPTRIIITGGGAAALHNAESTTSDIDTYDGVSDALRVAADMAGVETGLRIPVGRSFIGEYPWFFEDRLERRFPELTQLEVFVLERHDLALSKSLRGSDNDQRQLTEMHLSAPFDFSTLVERFRTEMTHVTGNQAEHRERFLALIDLLFGELRRVTADRELRAKGR
ncbi:MAG: hypothetical protein K8M05_33610 [Deltaproteobacteria bacterium]|nr:hypothetical protein [Kofleriaceae bacterium]